MEKNNLYATIYLVRHGETLFNIKGIIQGQSDSPLTANGIQQAKDRAKEFAPIHFAAIFSSDLNRAKQTAEIIALNRKLVVTTSKLLRERSYGNFEGKEVKIFQEANKKALEQLAHLSEIEKTNYRVAPDVETNEEMCNRLILSLREIAVTYPRENVLVVSHGGIMKAFLKHLGWTKDNKQPEFIKNTAYIKLLCDGVDFIIQETDGVEV